MQPSNIIKPAYIFRGHDAAIHTVVFLRQNLFLLTADAHGWIVIWDFVSRRAVLVWRAHQSALLGVAEWTDDNDDWNVITHGRDSRLCVWRLPGRLAEKRDYMNELACPAILPTDIDNNAVHSSGDLESIKGGANVKPRLVHVLEVNTLNFCPFAFCPITTPTSGSRRESSPTRGRSIVVAVPSTKDGAVDLYHLPSERWVSRVPVPTNDSKAGIVMHISVFEHPLCLPRPSSSVQEFPAVVVVVGYEGGAVAVFWGFRRSIVESDEPIVLDKLEWTWHHVYHSRPHAAPITGLDVHPRHDRFYTSSADNLVTMHRLPLPPDPSSLASRPSIPTSTTATTTTIARPANPPSLLSQGLQSTPATSTPATSTPSHIPNLPPPPPPPKFSHPTSSLTTHYTGQQNLRIHPTTPSIFATAGWDGCVHIYTGSNSSIRLISNLSAPFLSDGVTAGTDCGGGWSNPSPDSALARNKANMHGQPNGFMTVAFSNSTSSTAVANQPGRSSQSGVIDIHHDDVGRPGSTIRNRRIAQSRAHDWVVAGSKDGRVVLWSVPIQTWDSDHPVQ